MQRQHGTTKFGKNWEKQDLVITGIRFDPNSGQQVDDMRNILKFSFFGDRINQLNGISQGEIVSVQFDIQGKVFENNGKQTYMTELIPIRIDRENASMTAGMNAGNGTGPNGNQGYQHPATSLYGGYPGDTLGYQR